MYDNDNEPVFQYIINTPNKNIPDDTDDTTKYLTIASTLRNNTLLDPNINTTDNPTNSNPRYKANQLSDNSIINTPKPNITKIPYWLEFNSPTIYSQPNQIHINTVNRLPCISIPSKYEGKLPPYNAKEKDNIKQPKKVFILFTPKSFFIQIINPNTTTPITKTNIINLNLNFKLPVNIIITQARNQSNRSPQLNLVTTNYLSMDIEIRLLHPLL